MRVLLLLLVLLSLTACGLPRDASVHPVAVPPGSTPSARSGGSPDGGEVAVWFVRGTRLEAVPRWAPEPGPAGAVALLLAGPTRSEVVDGLRTALSPVDATVFPMVPAAGTVTISVGRDFTGIGGGNQLLAVAQVVWTATQFRAVDRVCFTVDGSPVEVPTDAGLVGRPVDRSDYRSAAPRPPRRPSAGSDWHPADRPSTIPSTTPSTGCTVR
ncbi:GerMN domain-containing protein [Blastococcus tunisiensis]|uniref:Sporulation and spore germination n=1 Tax=Blastococcus tunisiensis TaxID=1798228 RepID=A0A1I2IYA9_9ACTN|nr:GerMN domain-containing protein [Blastococcus sp. DSM 46838]SFF47274.1 Sporulation and spore germination [Blastococcus sp. DSM 46838]